MGNDLIFILGSWTSLFNYEIQKKKNYKSHLKLLFINTVWQKMNGMKEKSKIRKINFIFFFLYFFFKWKKKNIFKKYKKIFFFNFSFLSFLFFSIPFQSIRRLVTKVEQDSLNQQWKRRWSKNPKNSSPHKKWKCILSQ